MVRHRPGAPPSAGRGHTGRGMHDAASAPGCLVGRKEERVVPPLGSSARLRRFARVRAARKRTRALVRQEEAFLRPGIYLRSGETVWRHWRVALPEHLRLSKVRRETGAASNQPARLRTGLATAFQSVLPPVAFRTSRHVSGTHPIAVAAHDGGLVLLDPEGGKVTRTHASRPVDSAYVDLRARFSRHLPTPDFEVSPTGRFLTEDFVLGAHFAELDDSEQIRAVKSIFSAYASLTAHEREGDCHAAVTSAVHAVAVGSPPAGYLELLGGKNLPEWARTWPLVPTATDASVKNLIITGEERPVPIDLGNIRLDPFFYFPVGVVIMARGSVLQAYLAGGLDEELAALMRAAGSDFPVDPGREALLALRLALTSRREALTSGVLDQGTFDRALVRRWAQLGSGRPASFG